VSALAEPRQRLEETTSPLSPVAERRTALGRLPFMLILAGVLVAGLVGLLMLQTRVQEQSFEVHRLQAEATALGYQQAQLETQIEQKSTPAEIARQARALGMVPNPDSVFIDVRTGAVVGTPTRVRGNEVPNITYTVDQQAAAARASAAPSGSAAPTDSATPTDSASPMDSASSTESPSPGAASTTPGTNQ